ncbi:xanthine dehydrogenase family protein subunit M [Pseudooceanicola sp. CBS1P-1]|uniref:Xanthine dehydrogenase family protein subunit M n=1 Tax=Pseudooceanicola albus TaxID=2692189 RepID=A0A6L7G538_9RHOB|nr:MULTISPECIES: xanthine dehydrogenase family protein subunit M [Pseudooceanicola]MBT9385060.1 xanthine dehydrogenase family protein subunit M [Pseudooceanicola endophyticus]MXN18647.1 xanthine dehydrogenase family protein subunit M [Pseudooceanicola albus]
MKPFDFKQPATLEQALTLWHPGAAWLGGGTNLVDLMKIGVARPDTVIDITRIPGLSEIDLADDGSARIGALVKNSDLADHPGFAARFPMVAEALLSGASGQLRNAATLGGNLMQAPRCPWFQLPESACNRRNPGSGCDARQVGGLALIGASEGCSAIHPSDLCVPLLALDAVVEVAGPDGHREVPFATLHRLPGEHPETATTLAPGELIVALRLPAGAARFAGHAAYLKVRERTSFAFALTSAAAALELRDGRITAARLALGGIAPKPWRVPEAEALLIGQPPGAEVFARAAAHALEGADPAARKNWRRLLAIRTAQKALHMAALGTPETLPALPGSVFRSPAQEVSHA